METPEVILSDGAKLSADILIGADGVLLTFTLIASFVFV